jgi:Domain of unknown function (DUF5615)
MSKIRFFTDEDVYGALAIALRRSGFEAVSTPEVGRFHESDESQVLWATSQGYSIVTFNVGHFTAHHVNWIRRGDHHAGIIVSHQLPIGDLLRRLMLLANTLDSDAMLDRLEFLSDW